MHTISCQEATWGSTMVTMGEAEVSQTEQNPENRIFRDGLKKRGCRKESKREWASQDQAQIWALSSSPEVASTTYSF